MKIISSNRFFLFIICVSLFSCNDEEKDPNLSQFELVPSSESGITFNNTIVDDKDKNILMYSNFYGGAGVGIGDFNNDGLEDIYFAGNLVDDQLYFNQGHLKFENVTKVSGIINDRSWSTGVTVADVNNDGFLDIYVTKELYDYEPELRRNVLYINQGDGTFKNEAKAYGVDNSERTRHAVFFDYNKDGFLDLFILNQPPNPGSYSEYFKTELLQEKYSSRLYKNINGIYFEDVTESAGLLKAGFPNAVSASDLNNDGWTDLYVANDFDAPDFLYMNNGNGTFTNVADNALKHMSYYSMGVDVSDFNNDGYLDVFVLDMVAEDNFRLKSNMSGMNPSSFWKLVNSGKHRQYMFNNLHLNNGNNTFSEIAQLCNMAATDWSWANLIADFDNDGEKDVYITNGLLKDIRNTDASKAVGEFVTQTADEWMRNNPNGGDVLIWDILDIDKALALLPSQPLSNFMFQNKGNYKFEKVANDWGLDHDSFSNGAAYADLDNDGDLDLVVNNINSEAFIYKNNSTNNYLRLNLKSRSNKPIFGTRISIANDGKTQIQETTNVRGIYSTSEQVVHFGLGKESVIKHIHVLWPNGTETTIKDTRANKEIELYLEDGVVVQPKENTTKTLFTEITNDSLINYVHKENRFDDYQYQILLPHKMSQFGPAMATADVNNDGLEDLFFGGAQGFQAQLFLQNSEGYFKEGDNSAFKLDIYFEDIDAVFFDVDNDGDQDLYVVSGGNEYDKSNIIYTDRLYINNGNGVFGKSQKIETTGFSGSVVKPFDFDADGDLDLFIGGRMVPRDYPLPASSKILENNNGSLVDVTATIASGLNDIGMVTDAIWSDYDGDNDADLILVGEWMPVTVFENANGKFLKKSIPAFNKTSGWWYSIDQGDFDGDGDQDYLVGNLGLNYKYKTTPEQPFDVYYKDFDSNGSKDIVLGYYNFGKHYPLRGFSCSSQQIPSLKNEFKKYDVFATLEMKDVYGKENLSDALHYEADTFASVYVENLGNGNFKLTDLPIEAQFSSINDMHIGDINADGHLDAIMVGNLHVSEIETTRNDAGTGVVLLGDGNNGFTALNYIKSGFFANLDAKKIALLKTQNLVLVANNDDKVQVFKIKN